MADSNDTGGRKIFVFEVPGNGYVYELDLGRAYRKVVLSCETGVTGDECLVVPCAYADLGAGGTPFSTGGGWRRIGPLPDGSYVLQQEFDGPVRYLCFRWKTSGITSLDCVIEALDSQSNINPVVTRANPVLSTK